LSYFFFQAEDGIRYRNVTGVQTCALPICARNQLSTKGKNYRLYLVSEEEGKPDVEMQYGILGTQGDGFLFIKGDLGERAYQVFRSEERRVGKESRARRTR